MFNTFYYVLLNENKEIREIHFEREIADC